MSDLTRPPGRYLGSKWRIAPQILALVPPHKMWVDAFSGFGSVTLRKPRVPFEVINDLNDDVVNVFRQLRDNGEKLTRMLALTPYSRVEYERAYEPTSNALEAARRFIFRSSAGIGSDSSTRLTGFRSSICDYRHPKSKGWASLPDAMVAVIERLQGVIIENRMAEQVMTQYDHEEAVHYVDPPYLGVTRRCARKGYACEMVSAEDHERLLLFLRKLKGRVIVSGYPSALYDYLLQGWIRRALSGARDQNNAARDEVVWMNFEPAGGGVL